MESATILTLPNTGFKSGIRLSERTEYSWRTKIWKISTLYRCGGGGGGGATNSTQIHRQLCFSHKTEGFVRTWTLLIASVCSPCRHKFYNVTSRSDNVNCHVHRRAFERDNHKLPIYRNMPNYIQCGLLNVDLLFYVSPIVSGGSVLVFALVWIILCPF